MTKQTNVNKHTQTVFILSVHHVICSVLNQTMLQLHNKAHTFSTWRVYNNVTNVSLGRSTRRKQRERGGIPNNMTNSTRPLPSAPGRGPPAPAPPPSNRGPPAPPPSNRGPPAPPPSNRGAPVSSPSSRGPSSIGSRPPPPPNSRAPPLPRGGPPPIPRSQPPPPPSRVNPPPPPPPR